MYQKKGFTFRLAVILLLAVLLVGTVVYYAASSIKNAVIASKGTELALAGDYEGAGDSFGHIKDVNTSYESAWMYCAAHQDYEEGDVNSAYWAMRNVSISKLPEELQAEAQTFSATLDTAFMEYIDEEVQRKQEEEEKKITEGIPFVGMSESRIGDTTLGKPSSTVRHNTAMQDGKRYTANLYDFYSGGLLAYTVRCVNGKVESVYEWDPDSQPAWAGSGSSSSYSYSSSKKSSSSSTDSYDDGYDDVYYDEDYDYDRYQTDTAYANGVDDALDELGEDW